MNDHVEIRKRKRESLVTIFFTVFSVYMLFVAVLLQWSAVIVPVLAIEVAFAWWMYLTRFQNYLNRAVILTFMGCLNITLYGIQGETFMVLIPTLCTYAVLFSYYQMQLPLYVVVADAAFLLLFHIFVKKSFIIPDNPLELNRMALQLLSVSVVFGLCGHNIKRQEEEDRDVRALEKKADKAEKIKDDFVANTSHELRTPINTISGMSEILLQEELPERVHREVLDIQMTGIELHNIVTDILDYASLEAGSMELAPRAYNITSTLNDVMNMTVFQNREKNLELIFDCDPAIPCSLYGDEQQLRRVINNLIGNAIKFTSVGGVTVSVGFRREAYGVNLMVSVKDTGIGLTQEEQERIFQSFYQTDSDRNRRVEGMGLGLTISSALIRKMGGFLTVRSEKGKGSEFAFSIPQQVMDERPCIALTHPHQIRVIWYFDEEGSIAAIRDDYIDHIHHIAEHLGIYMHRSISLRELKRRLEQSGFTHLLIGMREYKEDPKYFDEMAEQIPTILIVDRNVRLPETSRMHILYKPYNAMILAEIFNGGDVLSNPRKYHEVRRFIAPEAKVLVVDDNIMNLKVVEGLLRRYRIKITAASSGEEALTQIESRDYDFVFMDHMMPGMDGIECLHRIRDKGGRYYEKVPIIALTANAIAGSREMFLEEGFDDFVAKPIDNTVLDQVLATYIPESKKREVEEEEEWIELADAIAGNSAEGAMDGIDLSSALAYCGGSFTDFAELARIYCENGGKNAKEISDYYDAGDWKNYAILVHALKSTSKTIGATVLSELAFKQEQASKSEDVPAILEHHDMMMTEYARILGQLRANPDIMGVQAEAQTGGLDEELDDAKMQGMIRELRALLETFEGDAVTDYVHARADATFRGERIGDLLAPVLAKVDAFDFAGAEDALNAIGAEGGVLL